MSSQLPAISVVIVTWNCAALLDACMRSLQQNAGDVDYEVIVVDNASADGTAAHVAATWPAARLIANEENTGFARASNQGIAAARHELVCLLNPDTELIEADTLQRMVQRMAVHPDIAMAGVRLVFPDRSHQVGDGGHLPSVAAVLAHATLLTRLSPRHFRGLFLQDGCARPPFEAVGWVCGACTLVRKSAVARAGGLDESYFMYGEDIEWGCRFNRLGERVAYLPDITIVHHQGGTQKNAGLPPTRWIDGMARMYHDHHGGRHWTLFRYALAAGFGLRALLYTLRGNAGSRGAEMRAYARHMLTLKRPDRT